MWCPIFYANWEEAQKIGLVHTTLPTINKHFVWDYKTKDAGVQLCTGSPEMPCFCSSLSREQGKPTNSPGKRLAARGSFFGLKHVTGCMGSKNVGVLIHAILWAASVSSMFQGAFHDGGWVTQGIIFSQSGPLKEATFPRSCTLQHL